MGLTKLEEIVAKVVLCCEKMRNVGKTVGDDTFLKVDVVILVSVISLLLGW